VAALTFGLLAVASTPTFAQGPTISLNQKRIRIEQLVKRIGEATERTILLPDDVRGTVSIVAKRPVTLDEAWSILESCLSVLGFSLLPSTAGTWRVAKVAVAVGEAPFRLDAGTDSDSYVTTLIPLRVAKLTDVLKILEPLSGSRVTLVPFEATNSLIASGSERAIARLTEIADELDRIEEQTLRMRVLRYRDVAEVESFVESFLESKGVAVRGVQVWSDERTNSLVVRGDFDHVARVINFIDDIDRPIETAGAIRILRVLHRDPEEVADLIRSFADPVESATSQAASSATALTGADFSIAVDKRSRSLVVRADFQAHIAIREILEILDVQPQLIAVDITVSEIRTPQSSALSFGFQIPFSAGNDASDLFGVINTLPTQGALPFVPTVVGRVQRDSGISFQTTGPNGQTIDVPLLQTGAFAATDFKGTNEILIQPNLIVTAGDHHEIFVGTNIPIPVEGDSGANAEASLSRTLSRTTTFDRQDIGTRLGIEVTAGREGKIQLDLEIELSNIDPTQVGLGGDPREVGVSYTEQFLTVTARLEDGESAVLEGVLIENVHLVIAARARRVSNPSELVADTIRRRLTFERRRAREGALPKAKGSPYGVRVTTRERKDDAEAISDSLALRGYQTETHAWSASGKDYFDVYVIGLGSMVDAAEVAQVLSNDGWQTDLVVLPTRG